jgi:CheY-like chemotaxis protein
VVQAEDGNKGLAEARVCNPDLILCDIMMPGLNGYEVCTELKNDPDTAGIPIIFLTAKFESRDVHTGMLAGAHAYLSKPFEFDELISTIGHCLKDAQDR